MTAGILQTVPLKSSGFALSCLIGVCFTMLTLLPLCLRVLKARIAKPQREILWVEYHERVG